jgi:ATP-dependent protease HslVU (ClpYQ) peptidase subunit
MSTIVAVKKNGYVAIAADTLTMWGSMKESAEHIENNEKILKFQDNYLAFTGSASFKLVVAHWLAKSKRKPKLDSVENIFDSWISFHKELKDKYFLRSDDEDSDAFETSRMNVLIVNPNGVFSVGVLRDVTEFKRFAAFGSGCDFAIGAMRVLYDDETKSAEDIAKIGIEIAAEFDDATGLPLNCYTIKLK